MCLYVCLFVCLSVCMFVFVARVVCVLVSEECRGSVEIGGAGCSRGC